MFVGIVFARVGLISTTDGSFRRADIPDAACRILVMLETVSSNIRGFDYRLARVVRNGFSRKQVKVLLAAVIPRLAKENA